MSNVAEELKNIIAEQGNVDAYSIRSESSFTDDLKFDSLDLVELVSKVEDEFGLKNIEDDPALQNVTTFGEAVKFLESKLNR